VKNLTKWKFEFVVDAKDATEEEVKRFRNKIQIEISLMAYGNPCPIIPIEIIEMSKVS